MSDATKLKPCPENTLDYQIELLPLTGKWFLFKTQGSHLGEYKATWEDTYGSKHIEYGAYGASPLEAMTKLVKEIRG